MGAAVWEGFPAKSGSGVILVPTIRVSIAISGIKSRPDMEFTLITSRVVTFPKSFRSTRPGRRSATEPRVDARVGGTSARSSRALTGLTWLTREPGR